MQDLKALKPDVAGSTTHCRSLMAWGGRYGPLSRHRNQP
jgi:hypothetical protein